MTMKTPHAHTMEDRSITTVWLILLTLTALLVAVSRLSPAWAVAGMLTLTPLKAGLVMYYFMHLKYEGLLLKGMVSIALATLIIFIGMMFMDLAYR